jgi:hypothetical protein
MITKSGTDEGLCLLASWRISTATGAIIFKDGTKSFYERLYR